MSWEDIVVWIIFTIWALFVIFLVIASEVDVLKLARSVKGWFNFRPTPLQREIMQEEKEIKQLEKLKADMKRRDQLRERKERLFKEISAEEVKPYAVDPLPTLRNEHYRWCVVCGSYFSGNHCDCLDDKEVKAHTPEQVINILNNRITTRGEWIKNYNEAMEKLRN